MTLRFKHFSFYLLTVALLFFSQSLFAQSEKEVARIRKATEMVNERGEIYLSVFRRDMQPDLIKHLSLDYFQGKKVYAYCNKQTLEMLIEKNIEFVVEEAPGDVNFNLNIKSVDALLSMDLSQDWDFYPTYEAYEALMYQFEADFPNLCQIYNAGTLPSGRSLLFARISADVITRKAEPRFMYTSTMHGDETAGFILLQRLIHHLLNNYGIDDEITELLDNIEIWICPNENPDGTYTNDNSTINGATRSNANGIDLNRNYPNPENNPTSEIQPETQAMIRLTDSLSFAMSANLHGGFECINYPWDSWTSAIKIHADDNWWKLVAREYADTARFYSPANYMNPSGQSFNNGVTHGGDWYVIYGSRQDYMNYYANQRELTLELSGTKLLHPAQLPAHWTYNYRSLVNYMKQANYGIRGIVRDYYTDEPLLAKIEILNHDIYNSYVFSEPPLGDYYRPLIEGTYNLAFSAEGYRTRVFENVSIQNYETLILDVKLIDESHGPFSLSFLVTDSQFQPIDDAIISLSGKSNSPGAYAFYDLQPDSYEYSVSRQFFYTTEGSVEIVDEDVIKEIVLVSDHTQISSSPATNSITIYPNPATDRVFVKSERKIDKISLMDITGRIVSESTPGSDNFSLSLAGLDVGIYFIINYSDKGIKAQKLQVFKK